MNKAVGRFTHRHTAHCETGVTAGLLSHYGTAISEAMVFGIGSGLFFAHVPFLKMGSLPMTTYRMPPGYIFRKATERLGVRKSEKRYRSKKKAMSDLDALLDQGIPVGVQTSVYWLPYFPEGMRFHFNAHNIVVYGRDGGDYLVSDPVIDDPVRCPVKDLERARFAQGPLAPKGRLYHMTSAGNPALIPKAAIAGLKQTCFIMSAPVGPIGFRGPAYLAKRLRRWPELGLREAKLNLGTVVRMQEEIGTGGGGFRFMFAAFLAELADMLDDDRLRDSSARMTAAGDRWREFAVHAARACKGREDAAGYDEMASILEDCGRREKSVLNELRAIAKSIKV